jgi:hypothetical protein
LAGVGMGIPSDLIACSRCLFSLYLLSSPHPALSRLGTTLSYLTRENRIEKCACCQSPGRFLLPRLFPYSARWPRRPLARCAAFQHLGCWYTTGMQDWHEGWMR